MNRGAANVSQPNATARGHRSLQEDSFVLSLDPGFAVGVYAFAEGHRVAADRAVLDVVLVRPPGDIHWHDDLLKTAIYRNYVALTQMGPP